MANSDAPIYYYNDVIFVRDFPARNIKKGERFGSVVATKFRLGDGFQFYTINPTNGKTFLIGGDIRRIFDHLRFVDEIQKNHFVRMNEKWLPKDLEMMNVEKVSETIDQIEPVAIEEALSPEQFDEPKPEGWDDLPM